MFAGELLIEEGMDPAEVVEAAIPIGEAVRKLIRLNVRTPPALTPHIHQSHLVGLTWYVFAAVGVLSAIMMDFYGRWIAKLAARQSR